MATTKNKTTGSKTNSKTTSKPFVETVKAGSTTKDVNDYSEWNAAILQKQADKAAEGKQRYIAYDSNGAAHIATSQERAQQIADSYTNGSNTIYNTNGVTYNVTPITQTDVDNAYNQGQEAAKAYTDEAINNALANYQAIYTNQQADNTAALQAAQAASKQQINTNYDDSARNYYQLYKTQQAKLPENLSKLGVTGGASETAELNLLNSYANNLYRNESGRNTQLAGVEQDYNDKIAENSINAANSMASAYLQMAQQQLKYQREDEEAAAEAQAAAEETAAAQALETYNKKVRKRMAEVLAKGKTLWTWTDSNGRICWSTHENIGLVNGGKKMSPSDSARLSSSSSSGSTPKIVQDDPEPVSTYHTYKQTTGGTADLTYDDVERNAAALRYGNSTYGQKTAAAGGAEDVVKYVKQMYNNGVINETQAKKLIKTYAVADKS